MKSKNKSRDPDIGGSLAALRRASEVACKLAVQTNTGFWVMKNGKIVNLNPRAKRAKARGRCARAT
jgi:hypothetical protein